MIENDEAVHASLVRVKEQARLKQLDRPALRADQLRLMKSQTGGADLSRGFATQRSTKRYRL
ncbi:hypothetical protein B1790_31595 [Mycobacterium sp. AT1]|nr:hypothetical protein B1790_31595 [Mycobacterium sp. AT1]